MEWIIGSALFWMFTLILTIVWVILPFAVFGINRRLDRIIRNLDQLTNLLKDEDGVSGKDL